MKKFDIHCHVIPRVDDGAQSFEESLSMLKRSKRQGFSGVIATPHYSSAFREATPDRVRKACQELERQFQNSTGSGFKVYPGQEIFYFEEVLEKLKQGQLLTMAGSRYVLLEFLPDVLFSSLQRVVRDMGFAGYIPILAHIERYRTLRTEGRVEELIEFGACMQMNYRPVGGKWYQETARWCRKMLKEENIHFLSTDMHNMQSRPPKTKEAQLWLEKHLDEEYLSKIAWGNAQKILKDEKI